MTRRSIALSLMIAGTLACSEEAPPSMDGVGQELPPPPPRAIRDPAGELLDERGVPRESDERVAGLVLPRGLTKVEGIDERRRHVYTSELPPGTLLRYFGPRLITMNVERRGSTVIYHEAAPRGVEGGVVLLDVTIEPSSRHASRVEIIERLPPPPPGTVISEEEIRRHFEARRREAE